jgi:hypothetical protein
MREVSGARGRPPTPKGSSDFSKGGLERSQQFSLASSTNLRYLDDLTEEREGYKPQVRTICQLVRNQLLGRIFQSKG